MYFLFYGLGPFLLAVPNVITDDSCVGALAVIVGSNPGDTMYWCMTFSLDPNVYSSEYASIWYTSSNIKKNLIITYYNGP